MTFQHIPSYAGDPILSLMEQFKLDANPQKVNLGIGIYYDDHGIVPQFPSIQEAYRRLSDQFQNKAALYLPMEGLKSYCELTQSLLFGENHNVISKEKRIATLQSVGGSGALKIGADFLNEYFPTSQVWVSKPTWANHIAIFKGAGFVVNEYPYWDETTGQVDFEALSNRLNTLPEQSIVLLHPCCHNPTGMDLSDIQFDCIAEIIKQRNLIAFLDIAYQGLGRSLVEDSYFIRKLLDTQANFLVANSYSKIFSLYGDRVGAISVVCDNEEIALRVLSQLKAVVRRNYSSPPTTGALLIAQVLGDIELKKQWMTELAEMRDRIHGMRYQLRQRLEKSFENQGFYYLTLQKGMFSYTHLNLAQIMHLRQQYGIYILDSGRMCMAGLNSQNIDYVSQAISKVMSVST